MGPSFLIGNEFQLKKIQDLCSADGSLDLYLFAFDDVFISNCIIHS